MKKTKRACATGVALRRVFTVMVAFLLVIGFNACSNSGGGGGIGDGTGGKGKGKDYESGGKYYNEEEGRAYEVGDIITGGNGMIFYYSEKGFTMTDTGETAHFLEVSVHDLTALRQVPWLYAPQGNPQAPARSDTNVVGTQTEIGTGKKNTALIKERVEFLSKEGSTISAVRRLEQFNEDVLESTYGGGKDDWFLPSKDELNELAKFVKTKDKFNVLFPGISAIVDEVALWTSSQDSDDPLSSVYVQILSNDASCGKVLLAGRGDTSSSGVMGCTRFIRAF